MARYGAPFPFWAARDNGKNSSDQARMKTLISGAANVFALALSTRFVASVLACDTTRAFLRNWSYQLAKTPKKRKRAAWTKAHHAELRKCGKLHETFLLG
jgi:hypothetical protein